MEGENEELISPGSSENQDFDAGAADAAPDTSADSSAAGDGDSRRDLLSVVRDAVKTTAGDPASPARPEGSNPSNPDVAPAKPGSEPDDEKFSDVPFNNHPRFRQLVAQRNQFRESAKEYEKVQTFLNAHGVNPQEAATMLQIGAFSKTNPAEAWKLLRPLAKQILEAAGEVLPQDLQSQVRAGKVTREAAMEISRLRAQNASSQKAQQFQAQYAEKEQAQRAQKAVLDTVSAVERELAAKDPDFAAKAEEIQKEILWLQRKHVADKRGAITPDVARNMVQEAHGAVSRRMAPAPQQRGRDQTGRFAPANMHAGRVAGGNPTAKPSSMLDVVRGLRSAG
jgi:DNA-nicking Smr family endonuclease